MGFNLLLVEDDVVVVDVMVEELCGFDYIVSVVLDGVVVLLVVDS